MDAYRVAYVMRRHGYGPPRLSERAEAAGCDSTVMSQFGYDASVTERVRNRSDAIMATNSASGLGP